MKIIFNRFGFFTGLIAAAWLATGCQSSHVDTSAMPAGDSHASSSVQTKESQAAMTPQAALAELRDGNARFVAGKPLVRDYPETKKPVRDMKNERGQKFEKV